MFIDSNYTTYHIALIWTYFPSEQLNSLFFLWLNYWPEKY